MRDNTIPACFNLFAILFNIIPTFHTTEKPRKPSRYQTGVLWCTNGGFSCDLCEKIRIFHCIRVAFVDFVIMVLSQLVHTSF